jgi:hypothetical protein
VSTVNSKKFQCGLSGAHANHPRRFCQLVLALCVIAQIVISFFFNQRGGHKSPQVPKLVNKFIGIKFKATGNIENGVNTLSYPTWDPNQAKPFIEQPLDDSNHSDQFSDLSFGSMSSATCGCSE